MSFETVWVQSGWAAKVPGDVYNLGTVPVLLQCLTNHIGPQCVDSGAGLKQDRSEMRLVGCEAAVCAGHRCSKTEYVAL